MSIKNPSVSNPEPVEVVIAVTRFKDVLAPEAAGASRDTEYTMKLQQPHPRAVIKGNGIYVKRPGAILRFTIASTGTDRQRYFPVGIAFVRDGNDHVSDEHRLGHPTFPQTQTRLDGCALQIDDRFPAETRTVRHKFSVAIQRGSDGRIGIIDPDIIHEND